MTPICLKINSDLIYKIIFVIIYPWGVYDILYPAEKIKSGK